jgi:microsomal epoxide hydrolase
MATADVFPSTMKSRPTSFRAQVPDEKLRELKELIKIGKIAPATYENSLPDRRLGLGREWLLEAKKAWLDFDW